MKQVLSIRDKLTDYLPKFVRYLPGLFILLLLSIYGFVFFQINALSNKTPSSTSSTQTAHIPKIDPKLVEQLQSLQDNSTSVQTLFDQARDNPFQE